jgi:hypothetical protein
VPANLKGGEGEKVYHDELAKLIKPLIRHAIRYWEMTLMFIERTGMKTTWGEKTKTDLARVRALLLEQPAGDGGLPPAQPQAAAKALPASQPGAPTSVAAPAPLPAAGAPDEAGPPKEPSRRGKGAAKQGEEETPPAAAPAP